MLTTAIMVIINLCFIFLNRFKFDIMVYYGCKITCFCHKIHKICLKLNFFCIFFGFYLEHIQKKPIFAAEYITNHSIN